MAASDPHFRLRVPEEMRIRIEEAARKNGRSMNAEIVHRLRESFAFQATPLEQSQSILDAIERRRADTLAELKAAEHSLRDIDDRLQKARDDHHKLLFDSKKAL